MPEYDGSIKFDTKIETEDAEKSLEQFEQKAKEAYSEAEEAEKKAQEQTKKNTAEIEKSTKARKKNTDAAKKQTQQSEKKAKVQKDNTKAEKNNTDAEKKNTSATDDNTKAQKGNTGETGKNTDGADKNTKAKKKKTDGTKKDTDETKKNTEAQKEATEALGGLKTAALAAGAALAASATGALYDVAETGAQFSATMSQVGAISGASGKDFEALTEKAKEMGAATVFSASQASEAMTYMAMAGWKTEDMLNGIEGIMNLAAASGESLAATSDIVTDALTAFGLTAADSGHFADVLAAASSNANTNVGMMGETFKYVAPMAGSLGYSIEDMSVAIGLMANSGIKASMAGTSLNAILTRLATNTSDARTTLSELGVEFYNADGSARSFGTVMEELRKATADMTSEQKSNLAYTVAGTEASKGFLTILNASAADYDKLTEAIRNADGAAKDMADTMVDNLQGDITLASSALEGLKLAAYDCIEEPFRDAAQNATEALDRLTDSAKRGELKESLEDVGESAGELMNDTISFAENVLPPLLQTLSFLIDNLGLLATVTLGAVAAQKSLTIMKGINALYKAANAELIAHMTAQKLDTIATAADCAGLSAKAVIVGVLNGKISLATAAQLLFNAAVKSNPFGMIATAIGLVVMALASFISTMATAENSTDSVTESLKNAREEFERVKKQGEDAVAEAETQAYIIGKLKDRLYELDDALSDTSLSSEEAAEKKRELLDVIEDLKEYIPDLNIEIDSETGRLSAQRSEIDRLCESYGKLAIAKAKSEAAADNLKAAFTAQYKSEKSLSEALTEGGYTLADLGIRPDGEEPLDYDEWSKLEENSGKTYFDWQDYKNGFNPNLDLWLALYGGAESNPLEATKYGKIRTAHIAWQEANEEVEYWKSAAAQADSEYSTLERSTHQDTGNAYIQCPGCGQLTLKSNKKCPYCGYIFDDVPEKSPGNGTSDGKSGKSPYQTAKDDLSYRLDIDEITEKEYYDALETARDRYLARDTDEWKKATAEIYKYRKKAAEDEKKTLSEERKKLSEEERKALKAEADAARQNLDTKLQYGIISEEEYYRELAALRDRYYEDTDDAYRDLTYKLIDYEKEKVETVLSDIAAFSDKTLSEIETKMQKMREKLSAYTVPMTENEDGQTVLSDPRDKLNALLEYNYYLGKVKDRMAQMSFSDEDISGFFSVLSDMSIEDGTEFARLLSEKGDKGFSDYIAAWKDQNELAETVSKNLYEDEYRKAVDESAEYIDARFRELALELPEDFYIAGQNSAEAFSKAFDEKLSVLLTEVAHRIESVNSSILFPGITPGTSGVSQHTENTTVNNHYSYTIRTQDGATAAQLREAIKNQDELRRLGGIE